MSKSSTLASPITLPCGLVLPNRLSKAAMAELMAGRDRLPTSENFAISYSHWAEGGWGLVLSGNVQVDVRYLGQPKDTVMDPTLSEEETVAGFRKLAKVCKKKGTPTILQINHPGRQSPILSGTRSLVAKNLAPSAVPLDFGPGLVSYIARSVIFGTPREMTVAEIEDVVQRFAFAARVTAEAGFDGIEIHGAHGYLLAQFMSPRSNFRTDAYGGSPAKRVKIVLDIIKAVRAVTPPGFCVGMKLNSVDHQVAGNPSASQELQDSLEQAVLIANAGLDFLEISGGTYEKPVSKRTAARESFFLEFARELRKKLPNTILMVTGGFRTRAGMEAALAEGACDLIGLGRPAVLNPSLPVNTIFNPELSDEEAKLHTVKPQTPFLLRAILPSPIGAGYESAWYAQQIAAMRDL